MRPIKRILVAVKDPAATALPAVAKAARIAKACGAHIELFHAIKASVWATTPATYEEALLDLQQTQRREYMQRLARIAARLQLHGIKVSVHVEYDYPAYDAIVRRAEVIKADLIVARRHRRRGARTSMLRLTDWELLRHSPVPVLLVKRSGPYRHPNILAAVDPCHAHAKPAALDEEILNAGLTLTQALRGKLHAVHVYAPVVMGSAAASVSARVAAQLNGIAANESRAALDLLLEHSDIPQTRRHLVAGAPEAAINAVSRRTHADIVVLGALSRSGLKGLIIGNTAEKLLDELPCDLLIIKPVQFVSRVRGISRGPRLLARTG
jgi:universal stress protein E